MRRTVHIGLSLAAVLTLFMTSAAGASAHPGGAVYMKTVKQAHGGGKPRSGSNLFSHGGLIEPTAKVFIVYWGPDWTSSSYNASKSYVEGFFGHVGGSSWAGSTTQYCQGVPSGTVQCGTSGVHPSNPASELGGTWNDTSALPGSITQSSIATEATRAMQQVFGYDQSADYMVFTPSGHSESGFGTQWCAYHSSTSTTSGNLSYAYIPFQPDAGASCGADFVNAGANGAFDGFSIVGGHEYAETITDPFPNSGWLDGRGAENGDKCAWISSGQGAAANVNLGGGSYAVQSLWSNAFNGGAGGCVLSYP